MKILYGVTRAARKPLVNAISQELAAPAKYLGVPTTAYQIGEYRVDKNGVLEGSDNRSLVADLQGIHGFVPVSVEYDKSDADAETYAEREMHRLNLENQNVPDYSNRGQYCGDNDIPTFEDLQLTEREELGLGRERRESFQGENGMQANDVPTEEIAVTVYSPERGRVILPLEVPSNEFNEIMNTDDIPTLRLLVERYTDELPTTYAIVEVACQVFNPEHNYEYELTPIWSRIDGDDVLLEEQNPPEADSKTYRAELSDPSCPERMEIFRAANDIEAYRFAMDFCEGEVVLLELHELDENYNFISGVDIRKLVTENELYDSLTIDIPKNGMTDIQVQNLFKLVDSKRTLLAKALGRPLVINDSGETLRFVFPYDRDEDVGNIYTQFTTALVKHVMNHQRITAKEREVTNSKYAMRTWLLSLGFIGDNFKNLRKILLSKLNGSSAFA